LGDQLTIHGHSLTCPITIEFEGSLAHNCRGWYYIDDTCIASHCSATHAREIIPCFDEPGVRCSFKCTVTVPKALDAFFNMPIASTTSHDNSKTVYFHRTPPMSSYLLAIVVGLFDSLSGATSRGLPVSVYGPVGRRDFLEFPLQESISCLEWYEDFFGIEFPLPGLQLMTVPDFPVGGMENFGLILFGESSFLGRPKEMSRFGLQNLRNTICHEIGHMWFGDCVSPKWWDSLWLNEGFATLFPHLKSPDGWSPFVYTDTSAALRRDAAPDSRAIAFPVYLPVDIESIFDDLSYAKAAAVLRMLLEYIGRHRFREGLRKYLARFMYRCTETADFVAVLGSDFDEFFQSWIYQGGFPVVVLEDDRTIRQERFTNQGLVADRGWFLPLSIDVCKGGIAHRICVELRDTPIRIGEDECDWIHINPDCQSYCRVLYRGQWRDKLREASRQGVFSDVSQYSILADLTAFCDIYAVTCEEVLRFVAAVDRRIGLRTTPTAQRAFLTVYSRFYYDRAVEPFLQQFGLKFNHRVLEIVGWEKVENEPEWHPEVRNSILDNLARLDDKTANGILLSLFKTFVERRTLDAELMLIVFQHGAKEVPDGPAFLKEFVETTDDPEWRAQALMAIGCSPPDEFARIAGPWLINGPVHYLWPLIYGANWRWENGQWLWHFGQENIGTLIEKYGTMPFLLPSYFETAAATLVASGDISQAEEFAANHKGAVFHRAFVEAIEKGKTKPGAATIPFDVQAIVDYVGSEKSSVEET
jgi:puromycin-sensitive aminopeptidase